MMPSSQMPLHFPSIPSSAPAGPSLSAVGKPPRHRRGRRGGKKKDVKMQQEQHEELVSRLDQIRSLLQVAVDEMVEAHKDRQSPHTQIPSHFGYSRTPSAADSSSLYPEPDREMLANLAESFFLLEMELESTRHRIRDLHTIMSHSNDEYLRQKVHEVVDTLEQSIETDLARLCTITRQQCETGLAHYMTPSIAPRSHRPRRPMPIYVRPSIEKDSIFGTNGSGRMTPGSWEWIDRNNLLSSSPR